MIKITKENIILYLDVYKRQQKKCLNVLSL